MHAIAAGNQCRTECLCASASNGSSRDVLELPAQPRGEPSAFM